MRDPRRSGCRPPGKARYRDSHCRSPTGRPPPVSRCRARLQARKPPPSARGHPRAFRRSGNGSPQRVGRPPATGRGPCSDHQKLEGHSCRFGLLPTENLVKKGPSLPTSRLGQSPSSVPHGLYDVDPPSSVLVLVMTVAPATQQEQEAEAVSAASRPPVTASSSSSESTSTAS